MQLSDLQFEYPPELVATEKKTPSRILVAQLALKKIAESEDLFSYFGEGDVLVINNTKVLARRLFSETNFEILFLKELPEPGLWQVLCPSSQWPKHTLMKFAEGVTAELVDRGRTQVVRVTPQLTAEYFSRHADLPLPPYILKTRKEKRARAQDKFDYQTSWAKIPGSLAAPTASLHFSREQIEELRAKGVQVVEMTLHVGLGTFLPITTSLEEHKMHSEDVLISRETWAAVLAAKSKGKKVWALGTTVTRALESAAAGLLPKDATYNFSGETDIFIRPGFGFQIVDCLLTNFHQPESTLLALVAAFAGLETVKNAYQIAIENEFRLFSYGDLSAWIK